MGSKLEEYLTKPAGRETRDVDLQKTVETSVPGNLQQDINEALLDASGQSGEAFLRANNVFAFNEFRRRFKELYPGAILCYDRADLTGARLQGVNLSGVYLCDARLVDANLTDADLSNANLFHAVLDGADISGAKLEGADITGCFLKKVVGLTKAQLCSAVNWREAVGVVLDKLPP